MGETGERGRRNGQSYQKGTFREKETARVK